VPSVLRVLADRGFFLKASDDLLVSCFFAETGLAELLLRTHRCLLEARLDGQKPSGAWEGVCKAGSAVGSVGGGKSSCSGSNTEASGERTQRKRTA